MNRAFIFPGQGSQSVGMGKEIFDTFTTARQVFEEVDDALATNLSRLTFEGPSEELTLTSNTQPALMTVSIATMRVIEEESGKNISQMSHYVAGHSLGEYTALCASGAISLSDTAKLLRIRGDAMQNAVPQGEGAMAALIGVEFETAQQIAAHVTNGGTCQAANDNGGGQIVISGTTNAIDQAIEIAAHYGAKRAVKLPVSAPFHSELMSPAAAVMQDALATTNINEPVIPLIANVTAEEVTDADEIRRLLVEQVTGMVRWRETITNLAHKKVNQLVEVGAGKVLSNLTKRIDKSLHNFSINTPKDIEAFLESM